MRNTNKKGFTIVELVIVVAVIAILAAVLIPTFTGIIDRANLSADQKALHDMNTALAIESNPADLDAVIDALIKNGFNGENLVPVSKDYSYVWDTTDNSIKLVKTDAITATQTNLAEGVKYIDVSAGNANDFSSAITNGSKDITLTADLTETDAMVVSAGQEINIDLGGKSIATGARNAWDHQYALNIYGTVTLTNGTINARGVEVREGGKLIIGEGVTINAVDDNGGAAIYLYKGAEVEINGGTFKSLAAKDSLNGGSVILNNGGKLTINGGTFVSTVDGPYVVNQQAGETIINGGTFEADRGVVGIAAGTATIKGGTFTKTNLNNKSGWELWCAEGATVVLKGGTFAHGEEWFFISGTLTK